MLKIKGLVTGYGADRIIRGIDFQIRRREILTVLGHNGAGKSSVVRAIVGLLPIWEGEIHVDDVDMTGHSSAERIRGGIAVSFQDRSVFQTMTVRKNILLGGYSTGKNTSLLNERCEKVIELFPKLQERYGQLAFTLSGGERRMLSIAMALMSDPKVLLLDEPSTGLSPFMTEHVINTISLIRDTLGKAILLVEQNVHHALGCADKAIVLKTGTVVYCGTPGGINRDPTELVKLF